VRGVVGMWKLLIICYRVLITLGVFGQIDSIDLSRLSDHLIQFDQIESIWFGSLVDLSRLSDRYTLMII